MNFKHYFYLILTILSVGVFASCDDDDKDEYPKTIETEKLLVNGEEVGDFYFSTEKEDSLHVIDSDSLLFTYKWYPILPADRIEPPISLESNVDYTKSSVLLVGGSSGGINKIEQTYVQESAGKYVFKVKIYLTGTEELRIWSVSAVVPKVDPSMKVSAEVEYFNPFD